jgi:hypothetical protein
MIQSAGLFTSSAPGPLNALGAAKASQVFTINGTQTAVFASQTVDANAVLVKYTYGGDANMDGKLNVDDYGRIDSNIGLGTAGWYNGDFNYDGKVNVDDYGIIDSNIGIQGPPLANALGEAQTASSANVSDETRTPPTFDFQDRPIQDRGDDMADLLFAMPPLF